MNKIEELQGKIDELQRELDELKENEKENESGGVWRPKIGEGYFYINANGEILYDKWNDTRVDIWRLSIGNVFKTKEEAEFAVEKLKVLAELKVFSEPKDRAWDRDSLHWCVRYDTKEDRVFAGSQLVYKASVIHFESKEKAQQAIDAVGEDRVRKYYLEVGE